MDHERREYYLPETVIEAVRDKVAQVRAAGDTIDYLTFVPDGESTLDIHLGAEIQELKKMGIPLAIITNSSTIHRPDVRQELMNLDLVSVKVDAVTPAVWKKIDRPHKALKLDQILEGLQIFAREYQGTLITETMLIDGVNDGVDNLKQTASYLSNLNPDTAYVSIPTRPPARKDVLPAGEEVINHAFQIFSGKLEKVELLLGYEGNAFAHSGNTESDILSVTAVHPMREDAVREFLENDRQDWSLIEKLIREEKLLETEFQGKKFYLRRLAKNQRTGREKG